MAEFWEKWRNPPRKRGHVNVQFVSGGSAGRRVPMAMRRGGSKVELATRRCQVNGLPPKSVRDAIKFRPVQPPQPQVCPVERAKIFDFRSIINNLPLSKEGSWD